MAEYIGGGISSSGSTSSPAAPHVAEHPAPATTTQPPASNSGADDPKAGIAEGSGGVSSTADIGSPVQPETERQTVVGSVIESVFGKKERTAEEADAQNSSNIAATPAESAQKGQENSGTVLGAISGVAAAGTAAVASVIPGMASQTGTSQDAAAASTQSAGNAATSSTGASTTADSNITPSTAAHTSTVPASTAGTTTGEKSIGEKAQEAGEAVKETANQAAQSASETADQAAKSASATATQAGEAIKESTTGDKAKETEKKEAGDEDSKKVSDHAAAVRENKDAIPTAGGERIGEAHEGESKIIPDNPKPQPEEEVPGKDNTTQANTKANAGEPPSDTKPKKRMSILGGKKDESGADKPKFFDRLKSKFGKDKENKS